MLEALLASAIGANKVVTRLATNNTFTQMVTASTLLTFWKLMLKVRLMKKVLKSRERVSKSLKRG
jgi:hypothetical protein